MGILKHETVLKNLKKKGFKEENRHHIYLEFWYNNKITGIFTKLSQEKKKNKSTHIYE